MDRHAPVHLLSVQFFRRFFDNDLVSPNGDGHEHLATLLAIVAVPGLPVSVFLLLHYTSPCSRRASGCSRQFPTSPCCSGARFASWRSSPVSSGTPAPWMRAITRFSGRCRQAEGADRVRFGIGAIERHALESTEGTVALFVALTACLVVRDRRKRSAGGADQTGHVCGGAGLDAGTRPGSNVAAGPGSAAAHTAVGRRGGTPLRSNPRATPWKFVRDEFPEIRSG
jgi:hypothetical protein